MIRSHCSRRIELVDIKDVDAAGFPVARTSGPGRRIVLHRRGDGFWTVVDSSEIGDLSDIAQERAIALAAAVVGGLDLTGRTVTQIDVEGGLRWNGLWRAHHRQRNGRCTNRRSRKGAEGC